MLAGWLFADLFLLLLIAALATLPAKSSVGTSTPSPTPSVTSTPPPAPARQLGLDPDRKDFAIALSPNAFRNGAQDELLRQVNAEMERRNPTRRLVGFVLVFASDDKNHIARAEETANAVYETLRARSPGFASATGLGYWGGDHDNFELKVFLLN